jgi:AmmeMemoRadiSam system protein A
MTGLWGMGAMPSTNYQLDPLHQTQLLQLARQSIEHGLATGVPVAVTSNEYHQELQHSGASFVTLHKNKILRGCIGNLEAHQPLICDIADNAFAAAFRDPRFPAVTGDELTQLHIEISVLTPKEPIAFTSESELLEAIEPDVDGIVLQDGNQRSTFLPSVWLQLPNKLDFLHHLKLKAGMSSDHWSPSLKAFRYRTLNFKE